MFKKFKKSILTALVAAIALPLILALYLLLPKNNAITARAEEALTVSTAEELSTQLSANDTVTVQLTSDITSETTFTVSGVKTLDLNGYVVTFTGETGSVISVAEEANFTLKDSNPTKENTVGDKTVYGGVITGGKANSGGGVYVNSNAGFTMEGGNISCNTSTGGDYYYCGGGGVYSSGTFTMKDGTISGNTAQQHGGGVHTSGTFTMEGGTISGNTSNNRGGGVYVYNSTFTMNGGTIGGSTDDEANQAANYGGGVAVESHYSNPIGNFEMTEGTIIGNKTIGGGGVHLATNTQCTISGGSLINNIADGGSGGGVYLDGGINSNTILNISNAEIRGCAANTGGGIYVNNGCTANISNVTITGCSNLIRDIYGDNNYYKGSAIYAYGLATVKLTDGEISGNKDGAAIYWNGQLGYFTIKGAPYIYGNEDGDLYIGDGTSNPDYTKYKFENLDKDAKIGITGTTSSADGVFTTGEAITEDNVQCFYSNDGKCITVQDGEATLSSVDHDFSAYMTDGTQHWKKCSRCGNEDTDNKENCDGGTATCTEPAACATCHTSYGTALGHDYEGEGSTYISDEAQHWKKCSRCDEEDTDHKENCDGGAATCTAKATCSACDNEYGDVDENNHAWGEWTVSKEATVEENGEEQRVCSHNSSHTETRQTDKLVAPEENNDGLPEGAKAGIIAACILLALLIVYVVCYFALYRRGILLKGKFFDAIYVPMNAIFGKKKQEEENS